jgi:DNA-binding NtrC family response regulator
MPSPNPSSHAGRTILIVEDTADTLALYAFLFNDAGYRVVCAESVEEALRVLRGHREERVDVSIVLSDYALGDGTGVAMLAQAADEGLLDAGTPTIICTAHRHVVVPSNTSIVHKPISPDVLLRTVENALSAGSARAEAQRA